MSKRCEFDTWVADISPDVIAVTETWLHPGITDSEILVAGYSVYRLDRQENRGGGVALWVRTSFTCKTICTHTTTDGLSETLWCQINLGNGSHLSVVVLYRSPTNSEFSWCSVIKEAARQPRYVILGDFNAPNINWNDPSDQRGFTTAETALAEIVGELRMVQHVAEPTRTSEYQRDSCLDLLFTESLDNIELLRLSEPLATSDHLKLTAFLRISGRLRKNCIFVPNVWKTNFPDMLTAAESINWTLPSDADPESMWNAFKEKMKNLYDQFVPMKRVNTSLRKPQWIDREMQRELNARRRAWNFYRNSGDGKDFHKYKLQRNKCKAMLRRKRKAFESDLVNSSVKEPKKLFSYINRRLKRFDELPTLVDNEGNTLDTDASRADLLAKTFAANFSDGSLPDFDQCVESNLSCENHEVFDLLMKLDEHKAPGPDGLHPLILKRLATYIAKPLAQLFTASLQTGSLPSDWKAAIIKAFYKSGDKHDPKNYRPVSLTSVVGKLMEKWIKKLISTHVDTNSLIPVSQHGFVRNKSCITNLMIAREEWTRIVDSGSPVDAIFVDFSKAFDKVDHGTLTQILQLHQFDPILIRWIVNFLQNRYFYVRVNGSLSERVEVKSGVPQGTVLGPVLFNIFVSQIPSRLQSSCLFFADDFKLWLAINSDDDFRMLQTDLDTINQISVELHLPLNLNKCQHISVGHHETPRQYQIAGQAITTHDTVRDLGVWVRSNLKTDAHTNVCAAKGLRMLWALRRSLAIWDEDSVPKLLSTFIRPVMEHGAPAYFPRTKAESLQLERIQRLATRMIPHLRERSYGERCSALNLFSLEYRRTRMDLIFTFKTVCLDQYPDLRKYFVLKSTRETRGHPFRLEKHRLRRTNPVNCLSTRIVNLWNSLPNYIFTASSVEAFKAEIDNHLWRNKDTWRSEPLPGAAYPRIPHPSHI